MQELFNVSLISLIVVLFYHHYGYNTFTFFTYIHKHLDFNTVYYFCVYNILFWGLWFFIYLVIRNMESTCVDCKYLSSLLFFFYIKLYLYSQSYKTAKVSAVFFLQGQNIHFYSFFRLLFFDFNAII